MPRFNDDIFWNEYQHFSDLSKLEAVLGQLDFSDLIHQIRSHRQDRGRPDWPIEGMLNAVIAQKVLQHRSVSSFRRELKQIRQEVCLGLTVMLAVANHAIEAGRPEPMRFAVRLLAA